jgi:hypothetical protein
VPIQPLYQQGVDAEELRGENALGLHVHELPPAGAVATRKEIDAMSNCRWELMREMYRQVQR